MDPNNIGEHPAPVSVPVVIHKADIVSECSRSETAFIMIPELSTNMSKLYILYVCCGCASVCVWVVMMRLHRWIVMGLQLLTHLALQLPC